MGRFHAFIDAGLRALVVLLGSWALYAQVCVLAQASFATLRAFTFVPLLFSALVVWKTSGWAAPVEDRDSVAALVRDRPLRFGAMWIAAPFAIAAIHAIVGSDWLFWILAIGYLTAVPALTLRSEAEPQARGAPESRRELLALLALCGLAALLTSGTRRPDNDDAYYLSAATAAIELPDTALQSFDALHRSGLPPVEEMLHLPQVQEIGVGLLAEATGRSVQEIYYVALPPLWAVLGMLANWLVLRHFLKPRQAIWGTAIFLFLLVFWGDGHRTFGNFGFVRIFQGKAIYVTFALPLVLLAALRYRRRPSAGTWLVLALSQCASAGLTANGVVVAPLAAALALAARPRFEARFVRVMLVGLAASMPLLIVAAAMYVRVEPYLLAVGVDAVQVDYATTLGEARAPLVLLALTLLPALATRARLEDAEWIGGYVWLVVLVIFMPTVSSLASVALGHVYSWRLFWAVPVPLLISLAGGIAAGSMPARSGWPVAALVLWAALFAGVGPMAVSSELVSVRNLGRPKVVDAPYAVAESVVVLARPDAPALVPKAVAVYVTGFADAPPLVAVRLLYLRKLQGLVPPEELADRAALFRYSEGKEGAMPVGEALEAIEARGVATVVFPKDHRDASALVSSLAGRGFVIHPVHGFVIAARPR